MRKSFHKWVLAAGIVSASTLASNQAFAAWCSITTEWIQQHVRTETNLITEVKELETNVAFEGATTLEQVLAALKVVNRQYAGEEQRLQQVVKKSQEAYANTVTEQMRNERLVKIKEDYSYETGQGANACAQVAFLGRVTSVLDGTPSDASAIYKNLDVSPGGVPSGREQAQVRLDPASTDASILLNVSADRGKKEKVIEQLAGFAIPKPMPQEAGTPAGELALMRSRQAEAWRSPALVSLSAVAAMGNTSSLGIGDGAGSVTQALDALIDNYGGGPAYQKWTNALQMQSERGLMVELNRLRAISMRLRTFMNDSEARKAATMAALLAAEASGK